MLPGMNNPPVLGGSKFDINPHGGFLSSSVGGSLADETLAVDGADKVYQVGGGYTGGFLSGGVNPSLGARALQKSWNCDFKPNRNGVNSSPYPSYSLFITTETDPAAVRSTPAASKLVCYAQIGNAYSTGFYVYGTTPSQVYSVSPSGAYAGYLWRISFDRDTDALKIFTSSTGLPADLVERGSYTFTPTDRSNMASPDADFYIGMNTRGAPDGWQDIQWYEV